MEVAPFACKSNIKMLREVSRGMRRYYSRSRFSAMIIDEMTQVSTMDAIEVIQLLIWVFLFP
jgi:hypothetical protein